VRGPVPGVNDTPRTTWALAAAWTVWKPSRARAPAACSPAISPWSSPPSPRSWLDGLAWTSFHEL